MDALMIHAQLVTPTNNLLPKAVLQQVHFVDAADV